MKIINFHDYLPINEAKSSLFKRATLDYTFGELEPSIDKETMEEHYNVHYKKYTDLLNECVSDLHIY